MRVLLVVVLLTSFTSVPVISNSENSNFNHCRSKLYTNYPDEINQNEWRVCMEHLKNE
tara:strand:- start:570 stop:743 length:174 start_codon:yes stop_codon:yes gene_type:complete